MKSIALHTYRAQLMSPDATLNYLTESMGSDAWQRVLGQRFSSPDNCVAEIFNSQRSGGAFCCIDLDGVPSGWAVYLRFHERAGYDGSMKLVMHSDDETFSSSIFDVLSSACASQALEQNVHTLISVVDSNMKANVSWFSNSPFTFGGAVGTKGDSKLHVFYRKLL